MVRFLRTERGIQTPAAFTQSKIQVFDWMVLLMYRFSCITNILLWH